MEELFEKIEDSYLISNLGRIYSVKRNIAMKTRFNKQGYEVITLYIDNKMFNCSVHRLVAISFVNNPFSLPQVNHIDGNKQNNTYTNLEWCTASENNQHAFDLKLRISGERHHKAKLTVEDVKEIRLLLAKGYSHRYLTRLFPVGRSTITKIANGEIWKHD